MNTRLRVISVKLAGVVSLLALWELASSVVGVQWVPGVGAVAGRASAELLKGALVRDIAATSGLFFVGTSIGLILGAAAACALRLSPRIDQMVQPFITAAMSVPKLGLVPLLVLWFGTSWAPKVGLVSITVFFIVFALTYSGLLAVDPRLVTTARVLGANSLQVTRSIVFPTVWPFVLTGMEVALPWALSAAIVAEYLSAERGIGHGIEQARQMSDSVGVFYGIVLATVVVLVCNVMLVVTRRMTVKGNLENV